MGNVSIPGFYDLLTSLLLDYSGQTDSNGNTIDVSQGSAAFIDSAVLASALQGIYYRIAASEGWALPSVGQSTTAALEEWCSVFGVDRLSGESDYELYVRFLSRVQEPPAGGNTSDWIAWGKALTYNHPAGWEEVVILAAVEEGVRAPGSVDLYLLSRLSDAPEWSAKSYPAGAVVYKIVSTIKRVYEAQTDVDSTAIPGESSLWVLCGGCSKAMAVFAKSTIDDKRVLGVWDNEYLPCSMFPVDVIAEVDQIDDSVAVAGEISGLIESLDIGAQLTRAQLIATLVSGGAGSVAVINPSSDLLGIPGRKYVPGVVTITVK